MLEILGYTLFEVAGTTITVNTLLTMLVVMVVAVILSQVIRRSAERALLRRGGRGADIATFATLLHYLILIAGVGIALDVAGIDLTAMFAAGALFAPGNCGRRSPICTK